MIKPEVVKEIIRQYVVHRKSPQQISVSCTVGLTTVYYMLKKHNIPLRFYDRKKKKNKPKLSIKPRKYETEELEFWYQIVDLSPRDMAALWNTTTRNMEKILQRRGIKKLEKKRGNTRF